MEQSQLFLDAIADVLARNSANGKVALSEKTTQDIIRVCEEIAPLVASSPMASHRELICQILRDVLDRLSDPGRPSPIKPTPEILEDARRRFNEQELAEGLREIRTTGGLELKDFLGELEKIVSPAE